MKKNEIDNRNLQRHSTNNEGINNVLYLYNYLVYNILQNFLSKFYKTL